MSSRVYLTNYAQTVQVAGYSMEPSPSPPLLRHADYTSTELCAWIQAEVNVVAQTETMQ